MRGQVLFEEWLTPILDQMVKEQREQGVVWSPSKMIHRMGREIDNPDSVYYWCYKNDIPVFSPAITDGSIGDMVFFHCFKTPGLVLDLVQVACDTSTLPALPQPTTAACTLVAKSQMFSHAMRRTSGASTAWPCAPSTRAP